MARRTLINIDRRILEETINQGALRGIDRVSALEIAKNCSITDTTIFVHFKNKANLVHSAYRYILDDLIVLLNNIPIMPSFDSARLYWFSIFNYLTANPTKTKYMNAYHNSRNVEYNHENSIASHAFKFVLEVMRGSDELQHLSEEQCLIAWFHSLEETIFFAYKFVVGQIPDTVENRELAFYLTTSPILKINKTLKQVNISV